MAKITVHVDIEAPLDDVWREASDLKSHAEWMKDAESIEFLSDERSGVGTEMRVHTVVGPLKTTDLMKVVQWDERKAIGVQHTGIVTGTGEFVLSPVAGGTRFSWTEDLRFPIHLGGPITAFFAKPVLSWIWRRNLKGLKERLE